MNKFNLVVCGGTFDLLHKGHREFLRFAFSKGEKVIIGLTSDKFVQNKKEGIELYKARKVRLETFLKKEQLKKRAEIIPINNVFGPTLLPSFRAEAIVVSKETKKGAGFINLKRQELGLSPLYILISPQVLTEGGGLISSSRIRNGEINREGRLYTQPEWLRHSLFLPEEIRSVLRKPFGRVIRSVKKLNSVREFFRVITVGDIVTREFNRLGIGQKISVVDFRVARKKMFSNLNELGFRDKELVIEAKNPPGTLTPSLFQATKRAFGLLKKRRQIVVQVDGEEDLAVLPILLSAPLGWTVFYGQPQEGAVEVKVTQESKKRAYELVGRFSPRTA